jgi:hypothetical protein
VQIAELSLKRKLVFVKKDIIQYRGGGNRLLIHDPYDMRIVNRVGQEFAIGLRSAGMIRNRNKYKIRRKP